MLFRIVELAGRIGRAPDVQRDADAAEVVRDQGAEPREATE